MKRYNIFDRVLYFTFYLGMKNLANIALKSYQEIKTNGNLTSKTAQRTILMGRTRGHGLFSILL